MKSVWHETVTLPSFAPLQGDLKTDVLIIGGGLTGILCAYELRRAGVDCAVVEAQTIGSGTTGHTTAKLTSQHGVIYDSILRRFGAERARAYWRANEDALEAYRRIGAEIACDWEEQAAFVYTTAGVEKLEAEWKALETLGIPARWHSSVNLPLKTQGAIAFPRQAQCHPLLLLGGLVKDLQIYEHTRVTAYDGEDVLTEHGHIHASTVIVATHFPIFNKHGWYPMKMYQHRSYVIALKNARAVDGMYVDESKTGLSFRNMQDRLLLGGGAHRTGKEGNGWDGLIRTARELYPQATVCRRYAAQDCMTLDGIPYIGPYAKGMPRWFVATGFNKWGMTSAMVAAMILKDAVLGYPNPYAETFSPSRSIWRPQLFVNVAETTASLLKPTAPRCPHLGCSLHWNRFEHSWDCACHGSRFDASGVCLDGPANDDLPT